MADTSTTLLFRCRAWGDSELLRAEGTLGSASFSIRNEVPTWTVHSAQRESLIECEDATTVIDGRWHDVAITIGARGTHLFIDGYLAMCGTVDADLHALGADAWHTPQSVAGEVTDLRVLPHLLSEAEIAASAQRPRPFVEFAANHLAPFDAARVSTLTEGTLWTRFRTRGHGQTGTILSAGMRGPSGEVTELLAVRVDTGAITYTACTASGQWRSFTIEGAWAEGQWHDLAIRVGQGAVELYIDGFRQAHIPGQVFFADTAPTTLASGRAGAPTSEASEASEEPYGRSGEPSSGYEVVIGQDVNGQRLFGEVVRAAIYDHPLSDAQIKGLSQVRPLSTCALFDRGMEGAASYRIPSLVALPSGTLIAGADQRTSVPNDAPNHIQFVLRRSPDGGDTWEPMQVVIPSEGHGVSGASVIDSCSVYDRERGRLIVLIDHFPGGVGQFNAMPGIGVDAEGALLPYEPADGEDFGGTTPALPTSYLCMVTSDDEGRTWSALRHLNHQVKEEWMVFLGTGPGTGIQIEQGPYAGRLVIPVYVSSEAGVGFCAAAVYSDDGGDTWVRGHSVLGVYPGSGEAASSGAVPRLEDPALATYEATLVELSDGRILMLMRNQHPSGMVVRAISEDGGHHWGECEPLPDVPEIFSQPNVVRLHDGRLCFMNASQLLPFRGNGVIRVSEDEGRTWPLARTLNPGRHVYQSMAPLPDGALGVLWENEWQGLYFTRVPAEWLTW